MTSSPGRIDRAIAAVQAAFIAPALLFMGALLVRSLQSQPDSVRGAGRLVMWYATRPWTLWVLLIGLPLLALVIGWKALRRRWRERGLAQRAAKAGLGLATQVAGPRGAPLLIAAVTLVAAAVLVFVALHVVSF